MLKITNLHAQTEGKDIIKGLDLEIQPGETHIIMGPNGSGKTTLASILAGKEQYEITGGQIEYEGKDLTRLAPEERSLAGIFLAFQYPVEIPGISNREFLKSIVNAHRENTGKPLHDALQFEKLLQETIKTFNLKPELVDRNLNEGFSGGEKKQNEILQMALLSPSLKILDETDSGLDIDALQSVAQAINSLQSKETATLVITHYNRLIDLLDVDKIHVMVNGVIVKSGGKELAQEIEKSGYDAYLPKEPLKVLN